MTQLSVIVAVIQNGNVLLTKREDFPVWCLPGGAVDPNESVAEAAIREVQEETGFEVVLTRLVGMYSRPQWQTGIHSVFFTADIIGGELAPNPNEVVDADFFPPDQLPKYLVGWQYQYIRDAFQTDQPAVVWSQYPQLPFPAHLTRAELYAKRDSGELSMQEAVATFCQPLDEVDEAGQILQVGG